MLALSGKMGGRDKNIYFIRLGRETNENFKLMRLIYKKRNDFDSSSSLFNIPTLR